MNAFGLDFGTENSSQAIFPKKMMYEHSKNSKMLSLTMIPVY